jgi:FAD/FMN-containing dehydrogenase
LITPADADYETSREIWNRLYDRRPRAVVRCQSASDVVAAVRFAREYDLEIAVKGGGHHAAGYAFTNGGILLNLAGMRTVTVSPAQQRVVAQTGLTWAQFDQVGQAFGLACTSKAIRPATLGTSNCHPTATSV